MQIINQRTATVPIASIAADPVNPNQGDIGAISESIQSSGFFGHVLVQESTGRIIAGAHRHAAARALGATEIPVTYVDVDDERARRIMLADNRTQRLGADDPDRLATLLQELAATPAGLTGSGYDGDALDELLADLGQTALEVAGDPDAVPEVPDDQEPLTKRGDIIRLGRHALGCINSTDGDEVRRLLDGVTPDMVWTDPPYGVSAVDTTTGQMGGLGRPGGGYAFGGRQNDGKSNPVAYPSYAPVIGDDSTQTAIAAHRVCADLAIPVQILWGANHYASALPNSPAWIVWDKQTNGTFADAELAWTNQDSAVRIFCHMWNGLLKQSERGEKRIAPTQKPVALAEWCFARYGTQGDVVLDLFGGSGTCLIAAERTGRTCYMAELSEHYCDCIIARWEAATGLKAARHERVLAGA